MSPGASAVNVHAPPRRPRNAYFPFAFVVVLKFDAEASGFSAVTIAPLTGRPSAFLTVPVTRPCADALTAVKHTKTKTYNTEVRRLQRRTEADPCRLQLSAAPRSPPRRASRGGRSGARPDASHSLNRYGLASGRVPDRPSAGRRPAAADSPCGLCASL